MPDQVVAVRVASATPSLALRVDGVVVTAGTQRWVVPSPSPANPVSLKAVRDGLRAGEHPVLAHPVSFSDRKGYQFTEDKLVELFIEGPFVVEVAS